MNRILLLICGLSLLSCRPRTAVEVPLLAQRSDVWCWAACMEMILKFHQPADSTTQCELAGRYARIRNQGYPPSRYCCDNLCQDPCDPQGECLAGCSGSELQTIEFFWSFLEQDGVPAQYLDLLFSEKGYHSIEEVNWPEQPGRSISWEEVKRQIQACRPFMLLINRSGEIDGVQQHAVVATGIHEKKVQDSPGSPLAFVLVNDPWRRCEGCEYLLPYSLFQETDYTAVNRVLALVHSIYPKEKAPCFSCPAPRRKIKPSAQALALVSAVDGVVDSAFIGARLGRLPGKQYGLSGKQYRQALAFGDRHRELPIVYLSYARLAQSYTSRLSLQDVALPNRVSEVLYHPENGPSVTATFEQRIESGHSGGEYWIFRGMTLCPFLEGKTVRIAGGEVRLDPVGAGLPFEVVRYLPFRLEFYRFLYQGNYYFSPAEPYVGLLEGGARMDIHSAWPEAEVLRLLREKTRALESRKAILAERLLH